MVVAARHCGPYCGLDLGPPLDHLPIGESQHPIAERARDRVTTSITFEPLGGEVVLGAVDLDDQVPQHEVDPAHAHDSDLTSHPKSTPQAIVKECLRARLTDAVGSKEHVLVDLRDRPDEFIPPLGVHTTNGVGEHQRGLVIYTREGIREALERGQQKAFRALTPMNTDPRRVLCEPEPLVVLRTQSAGVR